MGVELRKSGIFTLGAKVVCYPCNGFNPLCLPRPLERDETGRGEGPGTCDDCGCALWVREEISQLQGVRALTGGELQQTGDIYVALCISEDTGATVPQICITALDGFIAVGLYENGESVADGSYPIEWAQFSLGDFAGVHKEVVSMQLPTVDALMDLAASAEYDIDDQCKVVQDALGVTCDGHADMMLNRADFGCGSWWSLFREYVESERRGVIEDRLVNAEKFDLEKFPKLKPQASAAQIGCAREYYAEDEINIDDDALVSECDDGSYWVQAWVRLDAPEGSEEAPKKPDHIAVISCGWCSTEKTIVLGIASAVTCGECGAEIILGEDPNS